MAEALKDRYSKKFYAHISEVFNDTLPDFDEKKFVKLIFSKDWKNLELKDRMKHTAKVLHVFLPSNFAKAAKLITKTCKEFQKRGYDNYGLEFMFFPDYVETYGIEYFKSSLQVMENITELTSCEFAIRPFIIKYPKDAMEQMLNLSKHKNLHVRRLASEGSRPRLPWAIALPAFKKNPKPVLPILENLKQDESEYVRRSVANNLNDISKDHPEVLLKIAKKWKGKSEDTDAIIKHASRTLFKAGDPRIMAFYGLDIKGVSLDNFKVVTPKIKVGDYVRFKFDISTQKKKYLRLEYAIYFLMKNGKLSKKVFKISEKDYAAKSTTKITKAHSFKIISTRNYNNGKHEVSVIVNGVELGKGEFVLAL